MSYPEVTLKEIEDQLIEDCAIAIEIECSVNGPDYNGVEEIREDEFDCIAVNLTIEHPKTKISKLKNQIDFDSFAVSIIDQHIAFLPFQLNKTFTNLHVLVVGRSNLTTLYQHDFEGLINVTTSQSLKIIFR